MTVKPCETCRWWKPARLSANMMDIPIDEDGYVKANAKALGYCEPTDPRCTGMFKGLVAADYSCGEHQPKDQTDD